MKSTIGKQKANPGNSLIETRFGTIKIPSQSKMHGSCDKFNASMKSKSQSNKISKKKTLYGNFSNVALINKVNILKAQYPSKKRTKTPTKLRKETSIISKFAVSEKQMKNEFKNNFRTNKKSFKVSSKKETKQDYRRINKSPNFNGVYNTENNPQNENSNVKV